jgi:hypothetical protein
MRPISDDNQHLGLGRAPDVDPVTISFVLYAAQKLLPRFVLPRERGLETAVNSHQFGDLGADHSQQQG